MNTKKLLPYILTVTILVPLIVEGGTLIGMIRNSFFPPDKETVSEDVSESRRYELGDEILIDTQPTEIIDLLQIRDTGTNWILLLALKVTNNSDHSYRYGFNKLKTSGGLVEQPLSLQTVEAGETRTVGASFSFSQGSTPEAFHLVVESSLPQSKTIEQEFLLGSVPVKR